MSTRTVVSVIGVLLLMAASAAASIFIYVSVVGGSGEPSATLSAPTLDPATPTPDPRDAQIARLSTQVAELSAANATLSAAPDTVVTVEATPEATPESAAAPAAALTTLYRIVPENSEVRFILTEDLRGVPTTVVGVTDQVAGDVLVDFTTPANSRVGMIRINARTLATDNNFRNGAIRERILQSIQAEYEFIEFTPTAITGLPASVEVGQAVTFAITGDLKVRNIVRPVTFEATVTATADDRLAGTARTTVQRADFNLTIPNVPGVANVSEEVQLEIDFVAVKVEA